MKVRVLDVVAERERQRKTKANPAALASEAVLMQYSVDSGLDRALAASLEAACSARLLRDNPMHAVLLRIKAAAQYFELWREPDEAVRAALVNEVKLNGDLRNQIFCCRTTAGANAPILYYSSHARWSGLGGTVGNGDSETLVAAAVDPREEEGREGDPIYGMRSSLLIADNRQLHELRMLLGEVLMPMRSYVKAQKNRRYECTVQWGACIRSV